MRLVSVTFAALALSASAAGATVPVASAPGLVVSHENRVYVGGKPVARGSMAVWSPDGTRLAFVREGVLYVSAASGKNARPVTGNVGALTPAWSPDGKRLAYSGNRNIYTVAATGGRPLRLTTAPQPWSAAYAPAYSPDGKTIAFSKATDAFNSDIFVMTTAGKKVRRVTTTQGSDSSFGEEQWPTWSPDGTRLVYVSNRDDNFELYSIGADGRHERRLTKTAADELFPRLTRDGARLVFSRGGRIVVAKADGTRPRVLGAGSDADLR
jgi:Tol biopolymer transport system component